MIGIRKAERLVGADQLAGQIEGDVGLRLVVDRDRVAVFEPHDHLGVVSRGNALGDAPDAVVHGAPRVLTDRANRAFDLSRLGNDVVHRAGDDLAHGDDGRIEHVDSPGDHGLQRLDDLAGDRDRIEGAVRLAGVPAAAFDGDVQRVGGGHDRATATAEPTGR